ncbi:DUF2141 domain-containing protein [Iodidimonas gelatinilytica]|nr:DUF2141 domain-containing protein [Iodidimonas gelatinilytica]
MTLMTAVALPATANAGAPIEARIVDLPSDDGNVFIMLCTREAYEKNIRDCMRAKIAPSGRSATHVFEDVAPGEYIIQAIHDANGNGKMDSKWYGKPKEAYGMSTNPEPRIGRPKFDDGVFQHGEEMQTFELVMRGGKRK